MTDDALLDGFRNSALAPEDWDHHAHLRVAYLLLSRVEFDEALSVFRAGVQALNAAHGVPERLDSGYHETLTVAWLRLIDSRRSRTSPYDDSIAFLDDHAALCDRKALREFYSPERIVTEKAKREFVEPDLRALPRAPE